jgi:TonB family protein
MSAAQHVVPALDAARQRDFRRAVGASVGLHLALLLLLLWAPSFSVAPPAGVIAVNLVSLPSQAAPAAPKPAAAKPPAPPKRPAPVVLPKEPVEPAVKPVAKPEKPKPELAKPEPKPPPKPEPAPERDYADVMEQLRAETGETTPPAPSEVAEAPAPAGTPGAGGAPGAPVSPEVAAWIRAARAHIRQTWVVPPGFRNQALQTVVEVDLDASGGLLGAPRIVRASGNPWYDEGVVRSIRKASPLPPPPNAGRWTFVMVSDELL